MFRALFLFRAAVRLAEIPEEQNLSSRQVVLQKQGHLMRFVVQRHAGRNHIGSMLSSARRLSHGWTSNTSAEFAMWAAMRALLPRVPVAGEQVDMYIKVVCEISMS